MRERISEQTTKRKGAKRTNVDDAADEPALPPPARVLDAELAARHPRRLAGNLLSLRHDLGLGQAVRTLPGALAVVVAVDAPAVHWRVVKRPCCRVEREAVGTEGHLGIGGERFRRPATACAGDRQSDDCIARDEVEECRVDLDCQRVDRIGQAVLETRFVVVEREGREHERLAAEGAGWGRASARQRTRRRWSDALDGPERVEEVPGEDELLETGAEWQVTVRHRPLDGLALPDLLGGERAEKV